MGNGCCGCCRKKVARRPIPIVTQTEVVEPKIVPKEKPYGYVKLFSGVKTSENTFTCPIISLHTYTKARKVTKRTKSTLSIANGPSKYNVSYSGPSSATNIDAHEIEENVRCIPIENIISISYSTDVKKEVETLETKEERARPPKPNLGCWPKTKACLRETFCCCPKCGCKVCQPPTVKEPKFDTNTKQNVSATRMILIEMTCVQHTNIHIPTHVQVLPNAEQNKFYTDNFNVETIHFYLVNNNEAENVNFDAKRNAAETFSRIIVQLRNMASNYPTPAELDEILRQQQTALFGDEIREEPLRRQ